MNSGEKKITQGEIWNDAARVGIIFGVFSSACLGLQELSALTGSTFVVSLASIVLWAVEFFGCILLMKKYMLDEIDKHPGIQPSEVYTFGRRVALLSGLILAAVNAIIISRIPPETMEETMASIVTSMPASMQADAGDQIAAMIDKMPIYTFIGQWIYCFLYGTILSAIMSRYVTMYSIFKSGGGFHKDGFPKDGFSKDGFPKDGFQKDEAPGDVDEQDSSDVDEQDSSKDQNNEN